MDSKLIARLIELIEQDIMEAKHLLDMAREDYDSVDANDARGQSHVLTVIAQQTRKLAQLEKELESWKTK